MLGTPCAGHLGKQVIVLCAPLRHTSSIVLSTWTWKPLPCSIPSGKFLIRYANSFHVVGLGFPWPKTHFTHSLNFFFYSLDMLLVSVIIRKHSVALASVAQLVGVPKGSGFDSWSGHKPRLQVWFSHWGAGRRQPIDVSLSLPFSLSL